MRQIIVIIYLDIFMIDLYKMWNGHSLIMQYVCKAIKIVHKTSCTGESHKDNEGLKLKCKIKIIKLWSWNLCYSAGILLWTAILGEKNTTNLGFLSKLINIYLQIFGKYSLGKSCVVVMKWVCGNKLLTLCQ